MTNKPMPSLGPDGWIHDTAKIVDSALSHFFVSMKSQTAFYSGRVASFQGILQEKQGKMDETIEEVREVLERYFGAYFTNVQCQTSWRSENTDGGVVVGNSGSRVAITIYLSGVDSEGKEFSLARIVNTVDAKVVKIIDLNNNGVVAEA